MSIEITDWLRGLGFEQYAVAFRDNDIDDTVLRRLTAEDLRELGVVSVGHRRRLLDAVAALGAPAPIADVSGPPAETAARLPPRSDAERRQLTVMFCDLVGSTPLSARLDPEDLRGIIGAYHRCVTEIVEGFGGFVAGPLKSWGSARDVQAPSGLMDGPVGLPAELPIIVRNRRRPCPDSAWEFRPGDRPNCSERSF